MNVGTIDRYIRAAIGVLLLAVPFISTIALFEQKIWVALSLIIGLILVGTAVFKFCPIYRILGLKTCGASSNGN